MTALPPLPVLRWGLRSVDPALRIAAEEGVDAGAAVPGWRVCHTAPGECLDPAALNARDGTWWPVSAAEPVAALVARGEVPSPTGHGGHLSNPYDALDWWLQLCWSAPAEALADGAQPVLCLDGIATWSQVWLNGTSLLESRSMHLEHRIPVGDVLHAGVNTLTVCVRALDAALSARHPRPRWRAPMIEHQQLRFWRTSVLGRTPGWSPPTPVVGLWREAWLESRIPGEAAVGGPEPGSVELRARLDEVRPYEGRLSVGLRWSGPPARSWVEVQRCRPQGGETAGSGPALAQAALIRSDDGRLTAEVRVPDVERWWPHTHGEPVLHAVTVCIERCEGMIERRLMGRVGFRSIQVDRSGGDFRLSVNGIPVFARGACWTPLDVARPDAEPARYAEAVLQVRDAGMNLLRVAGTMVYEPAAFFAACDEAGVLVWQEFMFANMDYPDADPGWLDAVRAEVEQQTRLWQGHPCLAVVCGNSEVEQQAAMWGAPRAQWESALFHEHLPEWVSQALPDTVYWPSSAHGGAFPHAVDAGTTSCYAVGAYLRDLDDARRQAPVWATECLAFANVPTPATQDRMPGGSGLRVTHPTWKQRTPRDLGAGWDFEDVRDHYLEQWFGVDARTLRYRDHERYLMLSRIVSGEVMASALAEWRRPGGRCRGAQVWFLRDLWAGAGWGVLDDQGLPKPCWHLLRRVLQPQAVLLSDEGHSGLMLHVLNEPGRALHGRVEVEVWQDLRCTDRVETDVDLSAHGAMSLPVSELLDHFSDLTDVFRFGPRRHQAVRARLFDVDGRVLGAHWYLPGRGVHDVLDVPMAGTDAALTASAAPMGDQGVEVVIRARRLALWVHLDVPGWWAEDEYVHLAAGDEVRLRMHRLPAPAVVPKVWRGMARAANLAAPAVISFAQEPA